MFYDALCRFRTRVGFELGSEQIKAKVFASSTILFLLVGGWLPAWAQSDLIITGVVDGPLTGGLPKAVEFFAVNNIADLSIYGFGSANNGGGTDGEEFTFPAVAATAGTFIYVATETTGFTSFFGIAPDYTSSAASINGDDAIELFKNSVVVDIFGDINVDGTGQPWEYMDGWAYRVDGTGPDGSTFALANWTFSGPNALDGETTNAGATTPFPIGTYLPGGGGPATNVLINEVDADQTSTDSAEFVELYDGGVGNTALDGLVLVFFNGSTDVSYEAFDLDGQSTDVNGFFVLCGDAANVANCDLDVTPNTNLIQNGADAVALYAGNGTDFPNGTGVTTTDLIDAIVYDTDDADDAGLLVLLNVGQPQVNENGAGNGVGDSNSRVPNGGTPRNTDTYVQQTPTPGVSNVLPPDVVINEIDADQTSTDNAEFVELYDGGVGNTALDGLVLVFFNGSTDVSYEAFDLDGQSTDVNGFFVLCGDAANVANCDLDVSPNTNLIQNGADAVALYTGNGTDFPDGRGVTTTDLIDAIVYDTNDADDAGLLVLLNAGQPQVNEDGAGDKDNHSNSRVPNGGTPRNTDTYVQQTPTPGESNIIPPDIVINEVDADTPGSDMLEFVELYDQGVGNTALDGLVVVFYNGNGDVSYNAFDLDGFSTNVDGFFHMGNSGVTPTPSLIFPNNGLQNGADAVALYVGDATDFPNGTPVTTTNLIDAIVYDTNDADDAGLLVLLNTGQPQVNEDGASDKDNDSNSRVPDGGSPRNTNTYVQQVPTPGSTNTPPPVVAEIFEIQGTGLTSPLNGMVVTSEDNVVTALATNGFFMQTPTARTDGDVNTSDGIFVFTGAAPAVNIGDVVDVTGDIIEYFDFTEFSNSPTVTVDSPGGSVPAAVVFDAFTPSPDPNALSCGVNNFECFEGMLIEITGGAVSGPNQGFSTDPIAEVHIVAGPNRAFREEGIEFPGIPGLPEWDGNPEVFELDPDRLGLPNQIIPAGSTFDAVGVLGFEFGGYELWPTSLSVNPATLPQPVRARTSDEVTIGTLNMFRLFENVTGFQDRLKKFSLYIRDFMGAPDILAVQEVENISTLQALADKIQTDDAAVVYTAYLEEGNDVGGIDVGFLVRNTVQVNAVTQLGANEIFTFDNSLLHDRPPLLLDGKFLTSGSPFPISVLAVHQRSLGGIEGSDSTRVRLKRQTQATSVSLMVDSLQTADPNINLVVTGDFNAYQFTDGYAHVLGQIMGTPADSTQAQLPGTDEVDPDLNNEVLSLSTGEQYSFVFEGSAQVLDHMLTSQLLQPKVTGIEYGRGNADAAVTYGDSASTALRSSDHDGLVMFLDITPPEIIVEADPGQLWPPNHKYHTFEISDFVLSVSDGNAPGLSLADVFITSATSDEPENEEGDGSTIDDIVIPDCQAVDVRSERAGGGNGRVYTINVAAEDPSGNVGTAAFKVHVPLSQDSNPAIDDGSAYEVQSGCGAQSAGGLAVLSKGQQNVLTSPPNLPKAFGLSQNYPNPFNPSTTIRLQIPEKDGFEVMPTTLKVYDIRGRLVKTLMDENLSPGFYSVHWDGSNDNGEKISSGIYFYSINAGEFAEMKKMIVLK